MSNVRHLTGRPEKDGQEAAVSVFGPVFAPVFATSAFRCSRSSHCYLPPLSDGTDPLFGGHGAASSERPRLAVGRPGGTS